MFFKKLLDRLPGKVRLYTHCRADVRASSSINLIRLPFVPAPREPNSGWKLYTSTVPTFFYFAKIRSQLFKTGLHIGTIWPYGLVGLMLNSIWGIKYSVFILGEDISAILSQQTVKAKIIKFFYRKILRNSSRILASSSFVKNNVFEMVENLPRDSAEIFYNGLDLPINSSDNKHARRETGAKKIIFSVSRHIERKGFDLLIKASKILLQRSSDWHVFIAGEGSKTAELKRLIKTESLENWITMLGSLTDSELSDWYSKADIFILTNQIMPNGDADGCPIVFLEAASYGVPSVGGNVPGTYDAIQDGKTGFVVDSKNSELVCQRMLELIQDNNLRSNMGAEARKYVAEAYQWKSRIKVFEDINARLSN